MHLHRCQSISRNILVSKKDINYNYVKFEVRRGCSSSRKSRGPKTRTHSFTKNSKSSPVFTENYKKFKVVQEGHSSHEKWSREDTHDFTKNSRPLSHFKSVRVTLVRFHVKSPRGSEVQRDAQFMKIEAVGAVSTVAFLAQIFITSAASLGKNFVKTLA